MTGYTRGLMKQRDELERAHEAAVAKLEAEGTERASENLAACGRIYDELVDVQKRIDAELAREREASRGAA